MSLARRLMALAALCGVLAAAAPAHGAVPEPEESIRVTVKRLKRALRSSSCQVMGEVLRHSSSRVDPDDPTLPVDPASRFTTAECTNITDFADELRGFKPKKWKEYGTGALVEGRLDGEPFTITFVLDVDGKWRAVGAGPLTPQIGSEATLDFAATAAGFVSAVATGNCTASWLLLTADSVYVTTRATTGGVTTWCADVSASLSQASGRLYDLATATTPPEELGTTQDVAFFGVETPSGRYVTLVLFSEPGGVTDHYNPGVLDYVTSRPPTD